MKWPKLKPEDEVRVIWIDAASRDGWINKKEVTKPSRAKYKKVSHYMGRDKLYAYFTEDIGIEGNDDCSKFDVPIGCILKIEKI